jgi:hypothetical protein
MMPSVFDYLPEHATQLMKLAQASEQAPDPGPYQTYLPWYGAALSGAGAHELARRVLPQKYRAAGSIGSALVGTGAGVHGGEALGKLIDKLKAKKEKTAEKKDRGSVGRMLRVVGQGAGGLATGILAGYGAGHGIQHLVERAGRKIPKSALLTYGIPAAGGGMGLAHSIWKAREAEELRRAIEGQRDKSD